MGRTTMNANAATMANTVPVGDGLIVDVDERTPAWATAVDAPAALCAKAAAAVYGRVGSGTAAEVSIVLADDSFVRELNLRYRGKDKATNVLSFPGDAMVPAGMPAMLGDIAVALETVLGEAAAEDKCAADHLSHMIVHGMLHLLGFDHEDDKDAEKMESEEIAILGGIGVENPYRTDGS